GNWDSSARSVRHVDRSLKAVAPVQIRSGLLTEVPGQGPGRWAHRSSLTDHLSLVVIELSTDTLPAGCVRSVRPGLPWCAGARFVVGGDEGRPPAVGAG